MTIGQQSSPGWWEETKMEIAMRRSDVRLKCHRRKFAADRAVSPALEGLEPRSLLAAPDPRLAGAISPTGAAELPPGEVAFDPSNAADLLTQRDVQTLLERAAAAVIRSDA